MGEICVMFIFRGDEMFIITEWHERNQRRKQRRDMNGGREERQRHWQSSTSSHYSTVLISENNSKCRPGLHGKILAVFFHQNLLDFATKIPWISGYFELVLRSFALCDVRSMCILVDSCTICTMYNGNAQVEV